MLFHAVTYDIYVFDRVTLWGEACKPHSQHAVATLLLSLHAKQPLEQLQLHHTAEWIWLIWPPCVTPCLCLLGILQLLVSAALPLAGLSRAARALLPLRLHQRASRRFTVGSYAVAARTQCRLLPPHQIRAATADILHMRACGTTHFFQAADQRVTAGRSPERSDLRYLGGPKLAAAARWQGLISLL